MNKTIAAIIAITFLASLAIFKGIDGVLLATALTLIGGLGGYALSKRPPKK